MRGITDCLLDAEQPIKLRLAKTAISASADDFLEGINLFLVFTRGCRQFGGIVRNPYKRSARYVSINYCCFELNSQRRCLTPAPLGIDARLICPGDDHQNRQCGPEPSD